MDRCGISCNFITLYYLSQISLLNLRSCLWAILLIAQTLVPYTGTKASWVQTRKALLDFAPGVLTAPFFQGFREHDNFIYETFKLCSPPKTSLTSSETDGRNEDGRNPISVLTALMISFNGYIPTQMSMSLTVATIWMDTAKTPMKMWSFFYFTCFQ